MIVSMSFLPCFSYLTCRTCFTCLTCTNCSYLSYRSPSNVAKGKDKLTFLFKKIHYFFSDSYLNVQCLSHCILLLGMILRVTYLTCLTCLTPLTCLTHFTHRTCFTCHSCPSCLSCGTFKLIQSNLITTTTPQKCPLFRRGALEANSIVMMAFQNKKKIV